MCDADALAHTDPREPAAMSTDQTDTPSIDFGPLVHVEHVRSAYDYAFFEVRKHMDAEEEGTDISVAFAIADHLMQHPDLIPADWGPLPTSVIVDALAAAWPDADEVEWVGAVIEEAFPEAARAWFANVDAARRLKARADDGASRSGERAGEAERP